MGFLEILMHSIATLLVFMSLNATNSILVSVFRSKKYGKDARKIFLKFLPFVITSWFIVTIIIIIASLTR